MGAPQAVRQGMRELRNKAKRRQPCRLSTTAAGRAASTSRGCRCAIAGEALLRRDVSARRLGGEPENASLHPFRLGRQKAEDVATAPRGTNAWAI